MEYTKIEFKDLPEGVGFWCGRATFGYSQYEKLLINNKVVYKDGIGNEDICQGGFNEPCRTIYIRKTDAVSVNNQFKKGNDMKEQSLFNWAVVEKVKVKDDNGNIDHTKLKVHGSGTAMPAFDIENAKLKAMQFASLPEGTDIDLVEVRVSPFQG